MVMTLGGDEEGGGDGDDFCVSDGQVGILLVALCTCNHLIRERARAFGTARNDVEGELQTSLAEQSRTIVPQRAADGEAHDGTRRVMKRRRRRKEEGPRGGGLDDDRRRTKKWPRG